MGVQLEKRFQKIDKQEAKERIGMGSISGKLLLVMGGSQGAMDLTNWVYKHQESLGNKNISIYCVTGIGKGEFKITDRHLVGGKVVKTIFTPFTSQISELLSASDLVVARAGASSLAEFTHFRLPSILVPLPLCNEQSSRCECTIH